MGWGITERSRLGQEDLPGGGTRSWQEAGWERRRTGLLQKAAGALLSPCCVECVLGASVWIVGLWLGPGSGGPSYQPHPDICPQFLPINWWGWGQNGASSLFLKTCSLPVLAEKGWGDAWITIRVRASLLFSLWPWCIPLTPPLPCPGSPLPGKAAAHMGCLQRSPRQLGMARIAGWYLVLWPPPVSGRNLEGGGGLGQGSGSWMDPSSSGGLPTAGVAGLGLGSSPPA